MLLGISAAISHSFIIWALAALALRYGSQWNAETTAPYFHLASAAIVAGLAIWMLWRTRRDVKAAAAHEHHDHGQNETRLIQTSRGIVELSVFEDGVPPVFRLVFSTHGEAFVPDASSVAIVTPGGTDSYSAQFSVRSKA